MTEDVSPARRASPSRFRAIVIGASAGAVDALFQILPRLPRSLPVPVAIVVHLPPDRKSVLAELYQDRCEATVKEADDKEPMRPGHFYFAAPDYHLLLERDGRLSLSSEEPVQFSRPSIDVLFESAADAYGADVIGVILTGANDDGAAGLRRIEDAGGVAIVQAPEQAYAATMPEAALKACRRARRLPLERIGPTLCELTMP